MQKSAVYICLLLFTLGFLASHNTANAQKDDTLYFLNGDRISAFAISDNSQILLI